MHTKQTHAYLVKKQDKLSLEHRHGETTAPLSPLFRCPNAPADTRHQPTHDIRQTKAYQQKLPCNKEWDRECHMIDQLNENNNLGNRCQEQRLLVTLTAPGLPSLWNPLRISTSGNKSQRTLQRFAFALSSQANMTVRM